MIKKFVSFSPLNDAQSLWLDLLRVVSAQIVLLVHIFEWLVVPSSPLGTFAWQIPLGYSAVMCFFVLSGFLIARSIAASALKVSSFSFRLYLSHRLARLWPTLLTALVLSAAVYFLIKSGSLFGAQDYYLDGGESHFPRESANLKVSTTVATGLFLNGMIILDGFNVGTIGMNGPLWSLAHEFWFYVVAGLVAGFIFNRSIFAGLFAAVILAFQIVLFNENWLLGLVIWSLGVALAFRRSQSLSRAKGHALLGFGVLIISADCLSPFSLNFSILERAIIGLAAIMIVQGGMDIQIMSSQKCRRVFSSFATYTFTLYAIHWPLIQFFVGLAGPEFYTWRQDIKIFAILLLALIINISAYFISIFCENTLRWRAFFAQFFCLKPTSKYAVPAKHINLL